jgi:hypothetical protein
MDGKNGPPHGGDNVPPDRLVDTYGGHTPTPSPLKYVHEHPTTTVKFQAKIEVTRNRSDNTPLRLKALLIELLLQHQHVDPTFHLLPHDDETTSGAITKANEIPNSEEAMMKYVKAMTDNEHRNNPKTYSVSFFLQVASSMTLGMMKKDNGLFQWLRNNQIWVKSHNFTTSYDVVNAGFISHMNPGLHHRDRINEILQADLKRDFPDMEIRMVPTTIKHGLDPRKQRITQIVACQVDRNHVNAAREALVKVFCKNADRLPKEIFFVPSPMNGAISYDLYFDLVNAHHEHMASIRSFAIMGIADLKAAMKTQATRDTNSAVETTVEHVIMDAKVPGTNEPIFLSIEPTSASEKEGRYLLLTEKIKIGAAEQMIDELVKYIRSHPDVAHPMTIPGHVIHRANRVQVSAEFDGYAQFLVSKVPSVITTNPAPNAWNKRREHTNLDYSNANFPPLESQKKARVDIDDNTTSANSTQPTDTVIVDFEMEIEKERELTETRMNEMKTEMMNEIERMKTEFNKQMNKAINESEARMMKSIQSHIGDIMHSSDAAVQRMEAKSSEITDRLLEMIQTSTMKSYATESTPRKKQQRTVQEDADIEMSEDNALTNTISPASRESQTQRGMDTSVGEQT